MVHKTQKTLKKIYQKFISDSFSNPQIINKTSYQLCLQLLQQLPDYYPLNPSMDVTPCK